MRKKKEDRIDLNSEEKMEEMEFKSARSATLNFIFIIAFSV